MPKRDSYPTGAPCWVDIFTSDTERAIAFYSEIFGWTAEVAGPEYGGYITFSKDGVVVAGGMHNDGTAGVPDCWSVYLTVTDAQATVDLATANGANLFCPVMEVPGGIGSMAVLADPSGAAIGIWQPGEHKGTGLVDEPGTPAWYELSSRDHDAAVRFYETVFGWKTRTEIDTPEMRYTVATLGDDTMFAGIMDASQMLPEGVPSHWGVYFVVEDTEATLARATALGATVMMPPEDTPYGRLAMATDPTGAMFKLLTPPQG